MKLKILFTNGIKIVDLYWLLFKNKDLYYGYSPQISSLGGKYSYHKSGQMHYKDQDGEMIWENQSIPIDHFKGFQLLSGFGFDNNELRFMNADDLKINKNDSNMIIDSRTLPKNKMIYLMIGILKPANYAELYEHPITSPIIFNSSSRLMFCTDVSPWIWVLLHSDPSKNFL